MDVLKLAICALLLTGCQVPYLAHTAYNQAKLISRREPITKVLKDEKVKEETKSKLRLVLEVRNFSEQILGLAKSDNYTKFVQLDGPYVSYIVHAAPVFALESYEWWFPIVGHVPYKGYFSKDKAEAEAKTFKPEEYDTYVRGVTAFSTLGWFSDPVFSSMLDYSEHDLVNTVIHETVHATLYFKSDGRLNERMATFLGDYGTELFYLNKEGPDSPTLKKIKTESADQKKFSDFLTHEMTELRAWYKSLSGQKPFAEKAKKLKGIHQRFETELKPQLKTKSFSSFAQKPLNNATLLSLGTYYEDLSDFERLKQKLGPEFQTLLSYLKNLAKSSKPSSELKAFVSGS